MTEVQASLASSAMWLGTINLTQILLFHYKADWCGPWGALACLGINGSICYRPLFLRSLSAEVPAILPSSWASGTDQSLKALKQLGGAAVPQAVWDSLERHIEIRQRQALHYNFFIKFFVFNFHWRHLSKFKCVACFYEPGQGPRGWSGQQAARLHHSLHPFWNIMHCMTKYPFMETLFLITI